MRHGLRRWSLGVVAALGLAVAGCETFDPGNPLIGRWSLTAPLGAGGTGFALGTYQFRRSSMDAMGLEQRVDYSVDGDTILVVPAGFGPTFEVEMIDRNTARLKDPITGGLLTLRRIR